MQTITSAQLVHHGKVLGRPAAQPEGASGSVAYELGKCFQLDQHHCLLVASMDAQGGGDKCVGNDGFVITSLADIDAANAIPLNRPEQHYPLKSGGTAWMAKFPVTGGFAPLGCKLGNGCSHGGAGTGLFVSGGMTFNADGTSADDYSEVIYEFIQVKWDGRNLSVTQREFVDTLCGHQLCGAALSHWLADGDSLLAPFSTTQGLVVVRFQFDGRSWQATESGKPFASHYEGKTLNVRGESEPSIQKRRDRYFIYTRGSDPVGRLYTSRDGLNYTLCSQRYNNTVPQALNMTLDGRLYVATNPNMDVLRNPLVAYPFVDETLDIPNCFGAPIVIHDQDHVRDCSGDSIPFVDHGVASNVFLEGRWRHLLWYRVCDLKERTPHAFQHDLRELLGAAKERATFGGLYVVEITSYHCTEAFWVW